MPAECCKGDKVSWSPGNLHRGISDFCWEFVAPGANLSSVTLKGHQAGGREKRKLGNKTNTCHTFSLRREDKTQEQHRNRKTRREFDSPAEKLQMFRLVLQSSVFLFFSETNVGVFSFSASYIWRVSWWWHLRGAERRRTRRKQREEKARTVWGRQAKIGSLIEDSSWSVSPVEGGWS